VIYRDRLLGKYEAVPLDALPAGAKGLTAFDVNNDSWTDLAAGGTAAAEPSGQARTAGGSGGQGSAHVRRSGQSRHRRHAGGNGVFRNLGLDRFEKTPVEIPAAVAAVESDFDGDGRADVALIAGDGSAAPAAQRHRDP
jgi:hypothetical protein